MNPLTLRSLYLDTLVNGVKIGFGTGFLAIPGHRFYCLLTARHNVTGRNNITGDPIARHCGIPDELVVYYPKANHDRDVLGQTRPVEFIPQNVKLLDADGRPTWLEHPVLGASADFVALRLELPEGVGHGAYTVTIMGRDREGRKQVVAGDHDLRVGVGERISIVGYPFGLRSAGGTALWATGFIASEPTVDYDGLPVFLVDCRGRRGQSGSPVVAYRSAFELADASERNRLRLPRGSGPSRLLGLYSGRVNEESDLGFVWKVDVLADLVHDLTDPRWLAMVATWSPESQEEVKKWRL